MPETSTSPNETRSDRPQSRTGIDDNRPRLGRYDLLLAVVPAAFLLAGVVSVATGVPLQVAVPAAASVGALALVDGLFRNPPRRPGAGSGRA